MTKIAIMAAVGLILGLVVSVLLLESGPGVTTAQILTMAGGALIGGLIGAWRRRIR